MEEKNPNVVVHVEDCSKSFSGVTVFDRVSFDLLAGEIHCLVGENGAGKSTFIKILSGAYIPDSGRIFVGGQEVKHFDPDVLKKMGVQTIYQSQFLMHDLTVAENVFMGDYVTGKGGLMNYKKLAQRAREILAETEMDIDPNRILGELDITERQAVQIARALAQEAKVLILDEPTASYGKREKTTLLNLVKKIAAKGIGVIYISHHLDEVFELADRVTVIRDGMKIACYNKAEITEQQLIRDMVGRDTDMFYSREDVEKGEGIMEVRDLYKKGYVKKTSFKMRRGEILGFGGMVGSGRTELANLIFGAVRPDSGAVFIDGKDVTAKDPHMAIKNGICLITEDRQQTGMFLDHSVGWNFISAVINKKKGVLLHQQKENKILEDYIDRIQIKTQGPEQEIKYLSGGNQQKVVLAKWLHTDADVIIFDEPTKGIDIGAKEDVYRLMLDLARAGKFIIMISSDMPELIAMSDRVEVMKDRKLIVELTGPEINEEAILAASIGG
ncbi:sugar ABC transporter ATP-binding protein [Christensenellaceae bacterium OttesenSCG-928-K19]|nr:sugar ABC transporter ATP-binding protein [Christensenellaceae bacterium OttesenSCG-928-K19]